VLGEDAEQQVNNMTTLDKYLEAQRIEADLARERRDAARRTR
jgi:hypothetical protein